MRVAIVIGLFVVVALAIFAYVRINASLRLVREQDARISFTDLIWQPTEDARVPLTSAGL